VRTPPQTSGALTARAIAGTRAVLLGFDLSGPLPPDLLGFAVFVMILPLNPAKFPTISARPTLVLRDRITTLRCRLSSDGYTLDS